MVDLTLELVEEAFVQWREQRSSRSESIPQKLWEMVLKRFCRKNFSDGIIS